MSVTVIAAATVRGTAQAPGSKSVTHRAMLLAAQCSGPCTVQQPLISADTRAMLRVLHDLGHRFTLEEADVHFHPSPATPPREMLDCANAGTALRLATAMAARHPFPCTFTGDDSLRRRPNAPLLQALRSLGAHVEGDDRAPFTVRGPIRPGHVVLPGNVSSQFTSGLLLSTPMLPGDSVVEVEAPVASAPYLDVTVDVAAAFGLHIAEAPAAGRRFEVAGGQVPDAVSYRVEGDWSAAAFPLVAAAITHGDVTVQGMRASSRQGDRAIVEILRSFGARVDEQPDAVRVRGGDMVSPGRVDVAATPDLFPVLAVLAAASEGTTTFTGGAALRHKESDRIDAMTNGLDSMGIAVSQRPDGLVVTGGRLHGARVHAFDDHRIHMAFAVAALAAEGETHVGGAHTIAVSYPGFHEQMAALREGA